MSTSRRMHVASAVLALLLLLAVPALAVPVAAGGPAPPERPALWSWLVELFALEGDAAARSPSSIDPLPGEGPGAGADASPPNPLSTSTATTGGDAEGSPEMDPNG